MIDIKNKVVSLLLLAGILSPAMGGGFSHINAGSSQGIHTALTRIYSQVPDGIRPLITDYLEGQTFTQFAQRVAYHLAHETRPTSVQAEEKLLVHSIPNFLNQVDHSGNPDEWFSVVEKMHAVSLVVAMLPAEEYRELQQELMKLNAELMQTLHQDRAERMRLSAQEMSDQLSTPAPATPSIPTFVHDVDPKIHNELMVGAVQQAIKLQHFERGLLSAGLIMNETLRIEWSNKLNLAWANYMYGKQDFDQSEHLAQTISDDFPGKIELFRKLEKHKRSARKNTGRPKASK